MKSVMKTTVIASLLVIVCLLVVACGGDAENFVQGNGQIDVIVTDSVTTLPLEGVQVQVRRNSLTDPVVDSATTGPAGTATFQETIGSDYFFTFTATGYTPQNYINNPVRPLLTATVTVSVAMVPL